MTASRSSEVAIEGEIPPLWPGDVLNGPALQLIPHHADRDVQIHLYGAGVYNHASYLTAVSIRRSTPLGPRMPPEEKGKDRIRECAASRHLTPALVLPKGRNSRSVRSS